MADQQDSSVPCEPSDPSGPDRLSPGVQPLQRRAFLGAAGLASLGLAALATGSGPLLFDAPAAQAEAAQKLAMQRAVNGAGTTLEAAAAPVAGTRYRRLTAGPGYPVIVREDLVPARVNRDDRRQGLAALTQFTDLHILDAQSPLRFEYLDDAVASAFRPQEALTLHGAAALVERVNSLGSGPFTGRPLDCVVSTGDNTDNHERVELDWFLTVLSGGTFIANTGAPDRWEGVQSDGGTRYYQPESPRPDRYQQAGFPQLPGFFSRVIERQRSKGLAVPWYSVFGNHDDSIQGTLPSDWALLVAMYTGEAKFSGFADPLNEKALRSVLRSGSPLPVTLRGSGLADLLSRYRVTADSRRAPFSPVEYMQRHRDPAFLGAGPGGHGFTEEAIASGRGYYTFPIASEGTGARITGIALDSTNRAGYTAGSLGQEQYEWLERTLKNGSTRYYDSDGRKVSSASGADQLFLIFSHHTIDPMNNLVQDPQKPEPRRSGRDVDALLRRFPNVLAWANGHTHRNQITPRPGNVPECGYWQINTASHIDFPQHARVIEVVDNQDGTLSLFATLIEAEAPYQGSYSSSALPDLAALYRELAYNDLQASETALGAEQDRNTELLLAHPWR